MEKKEKYIYEAFEIGLLLKGLNAIVEIILGIGAFFITKDILRNIVLTLLSGELSEDPKDFLANFIVGSTNNFSASNQWIIFIYLFTHGIIKLILIISLLKKKDWAYPISIAVFFSLIIYELYRFSLNYSFWMGFISIFDTIILLLISHEYRLVKRIKERSNETF